MSTIGSRLTGACLLDPVCELSCFEELKAALAQRKICAVAGPDETQRAHLIAAISEAADRPVVVLAPSELSARRYAADMRSFLGGGVRTLPARDVSFVKSGAASRELSLKRLDVLGACLSGRVRVLTMCADAALHRMPSPERLTRHIIDLEEGMTLDPNELMRKLTDAGYERTHMAESKGQCALRGGILDICPVGSSSALRIEFFDDEIDSIRAFDVLTQRSVEKLGHAQIYPAREFLLSDDEAHRAAQRIRYELERRDYQSDAKKRQQALEKEFGLASFESFLKETEEEEPADKKARLGRSRDVGFLRIVEALENGLSFDNPDSLLPVLTSADNTILDYLDDPIVVYDRPGQLREHCENCIQEFAERFSTAVLHGDALPVQSGLLLTYDELLARADGKPALTMDLFLHTGSGLEPQALFTIESRNATGYQTNTRELASDIVTWRRDGWRVALLSGGTARGERLLQALENLNCPARFSEAIPGELNRGEALILPLQIEKGFLYPEIKLAVISESDVFGANKQKRSASRKNSSKIDAFTDLKVGDYVVHENHGIGQFMGVVRLSSEGVYRDFLHIRYLGSDKLYVPTDQLDRVQKYIGSEETPRINSLSGGEWQKQKARVRKSVRDIASDLIKLYAQREAMPGYAFDKDTPWQREFEDNFPFEETPDQLEAIREIKEDMEKPRTMDRLLCGDVGYGKTEVALRAIFKAVMSGKQAAMLAPTTVLVQQHYATMLNRFAGFPVRVEVLSRFKTAKEQKEILKQLETGGLDVVVGTHRLLAKDIKYRDLGLLVVDEEQRFGVTHKEAIKKYKQSIDVLTLTATPIPRTLHMSMVGIRDMSLLQSPPEERYPVQTYVVEYSDGLVRDAILREIGRGGQVYVLYNRVQSIEVMYERLTRLVPEARIAVGHGQMREHALEDVMLDFYEGKFDVLLCTTIIEAGLDVQRANTLIVCNADQFGLSQLYQLRGRVGRSNRLAYAYLTVSPNKVLTESADKRLNAIKEFTEFGSGFRVAMRDLEIRGAGNLLGSEQSGFVASVGYDLYVKMIDEAVRELSGKKDVGDIETRVELKVDAYLPSEYIFNDEMRVEMYKKIASVRTEGERNDLIDELIDRFGDPPRAVMNLVDIASLKALCARIGIDNIAAKNDEIHMRFSQESDADLETLLMVIADYRASMRVQVERIPTLVCFKRHANPEELLRATVRTMRSILSDYESKRVNA